MSSSNVKSDLEEIEALLNSSAPPTSPNRKKTTTTPSKTKTTKARQGRNGKKSSSRDTNGSSSQTYYCQWRNWVIGILLLVLLVENIVQERYKLFESVICEVHDQSKQDAAEPIHQYAQPPGTEKSSTTAPRQEQGVVVIGETTPSSKQNKEAAAMGEPIPDWRVETDCSIYDVACPSYLHNLYGFKSYPFRFFREEAHQWKNFTRDHMKGKEPKAIKDWSKPIQPDYIYKDPVSEDDFQQCMTQRLQEMTYEDQLKEMMKRLKPHPELEMVVVTMSDASYATSQIHDFFEMTADIVGFRTDSVFMVAMDEETLRLGCYFGYNVIASKGLASAKGKKNDELRSAVQNTKFEVSRDLLVDHNQSFLFFEMDIYWLQSPVQLLKEHSDVDVVVSAHFDNPGAPNIGIYAIKNTTGGREFFTVVLDLIQQAPDTHDQVVFARVRDLTLQLRGRRWKGDLDKEFKPTKPLEPKFETYPTFYVMDSILVSAHVHTQVNEKTMAIHPLCGAPLRTPHGKQMMAKELGAWYGFQGPNGLAGYYKRSGVHRRYLFLDGRVFGGMSTTMNLEMTYGYYHSGEVIYWTVATMVALARYTNRILVLPKIQGDFHNKFLWWYLDMSSLEGVIDVRETNYATNPKTWSVPGERPFDSVGRTALDWTHYAHRGEKRWSMFSQVDEGEVHAYKIDEDLRDPIGAWVSLMNNVDSLGQVEALFVNPQYVNSANLHHSYCEKSLMHNTVMVKAVRTVRNKILKWCDEHDPGDPGAPYQPSRTQAENDCYGRGKHKPVCSK